jgi:exosortase
VRTLIALAAMVLLGLLVYRNVLYEVLVQVLSREDSSLGVCVPFIAGYLFWLKSQKIRQAQPMFAPIPGVLTTGAGLLLFFMVGESKGVAIPFVSFLLVVAGLVVGLFGRDVFRQMRFPLFFLATMIPISKPVYAWLTEWIRAVSATGSVWVLQLFGFPIYREIYHVSLPNINLFVGESCSGIRYLIPYFVFGLAYAFVCKKTLKSRALVVLATIPISFVGAILRQSVVFLAAYYIGPFTTEDRWHSPISWSVFMMVLVTAIGVDRGMSRWVENKRLGSQEAERVLPDDRLQTSDDRGQ